MKKFFLALLALPLIGWWSVVQAACLSTYPLFRVERSKNKNVVQYDVCLLNNGDASNSKAINAYWILENGEKEDLNAIETRYAYGIKSQEKVGENKFNIVVAAFKERKIIVERATDGYRAIVIISGKRSILEKIFVKSEEKALGIPKVDYVDLFGRNLQTNASVTERVVPQ